MKKAIATILAAAMLFACFTACSSQTSGSGETQTKDAAGNAEGGQTVNVTSSYAPKLPDVNYGGAAFTILLPIAEDTAGTSYYCVDTETGEVFNDSIYSRNIKIEDKLNIKFKYKYAGGFDKVYGTMNKSILAGEDAYDLVQTHVFLDVPAILTSNITLDWKSLNYIDFDKPYWNQYINDTITVGGKLPFAVSDYIFQEAVGLLFNKSLRETYKLDNPYDVVANGGWTLDALIKMAKTVSADLDGDGQYGANDLYGISGHLCFRYASFLYSSGLSVCKLDNEGIAQIVLNNKKTFTLVEKMYDLIYNGNQAYKPQSFTDGNNATAAEEVRNSFKSGKTLFMVESITGTALTPYRSTEVDFGIIPLPKYDDSQENYITSSWSGLLCIPNTVKDPDRVAIVSEMLAYETRASVLPAYYDIMLSGKIARDDESSKMLDIILNSVTYDFGISLVGYNAFLYAVPFMLRQASTDFASFYEKNVTSVQQAIDKVYTSLNIE